MDAKQFDLFQRTIQFAVDEDKVATEVTENGNRVGTFFNMNHWINVPRSMSKKGEVVTVKDEFGYTMEMIKLENLSIGSCGTNACLAGTAVLLDGSATPLAMAAGYPHLRETLTYVLTEDGEFKSIQRFAQQAMGITGEQAEVLFLKTTATIHEIVETATNIAKSYGHELEVIR